MHALPRALVQRLVSRFAHQHTWTETATATVHCAGQLYKVAVRACPCGAEDVHTVLVTENAHPTSPTRAVEQGAGEESRTTRDHYTGVLRSKVQDLG